VPQQERAVDEFGAEALRQRMQGGERAFDHAVGTGEIVRQRRFQRLRHLHGAGLELEGVEAVQRSRFETAAIETGPDALQMPAGFAHALAGEPQFEWFRHARRPTCPAARDPPRSRVRTAGRCIR
jgi:hypothetical protein